MYYLLRIRNGLVDVTPFDRDYDLLQHCSHQFEHDFENVDELYEYLGNDLGDYFELFTDKMELIQDIINSVIISNREKLDAIEELVDEH